MERDFKLVDFETDDYTELIEFWKLTGLWLEERQDSLEMVQNTLRLEGGLFLMKSEEEKIIGSCWLTSDGRRIHIHHFAVHPDYRNNGLGKILMNKAIDFARQKGMQVRLDVERNNAAAKSLFSKYNMKTYENYDIMVIRNINEL